jgi:hypothetical protein
MQLLSFFRKSAPSPETERSNAAIIELIYAGNDMAAHLVMQDGRDFSCVCGMIVGPVENPSHHRNFCPVARFYAAVEALHAAQTNSETDEIDRDCEALRNGTARRGVTRGAVAQCFAVLSTIAAALILAVLHFAAQIDAWIIPAWFKILSIGVLVVLIIASTIKRGAK